MTWGLGWGRFSLGVRCLSQLRGHAEGCHCCPQPQCALSQTLETCFVGLGGLQLRLRAVAGLGSTMGVNLQTRWAGATSSRGGSLSSVLCSVASCDVWSWVSHCSRHLDLVGLEHGATLGPDTTSHGPPLGVYIWERQQRCRPDSLSDEGPLFPELHHGGRSHGPG